MMKSFKYTLLLGASLMLATSQAVAVSDGVKLGSDSGASVGEVMKFVGSSIGFPVLDITSVPAHSIVALEQQFNRLETETENVLKANVKKRLTEVQRAVKTSELLQMGKEQLGYTYSDYEHEKKNPRQERYRLLSQKRVNPQDEMENSWPAIKDGFIEAEGEIKEEGGQTTVALTKQQQKQWTSGAGSQDRQLDYQVHRDWIEQEQAIRMMAQTLVVKQQAFDTLEKLEKELDEHYKKTTVPGHLKGNGSVNSGDNTHKKDVYGDYNKALREYAYQSLIYDQLLSLEQQILGMRLQIKGGVYGQGLQVISDDLETRGIEEE